MTTNLQVAAFILVYAFIAVSFAFSVMDPEPGPDTNVVGWGFMAALLFPFMMLFAIGATLGQWFKWADDVTKRTERKA